MLSGYQGRSADRLLRGRDMVSPLVDRYRGSARMRRPGSFGTGAHPDKVMGRGPTDLVF